MKNPIASLWRKLKARDPVTIAGLVGTVVLIVCAALFSYYYWWVVLLLVFGIWQFFTWWKERKEQRRFQQMRETEFIKESVVYILRHALSDLTAPLGLPNIESRGFYHIRDNLSKKGFLGLSVYYHRMANAPDLDKSTAEQFRQILNTTIPLIQSDLVCENGTFPLPLYIWGVRANKNAIRIDVVPIIDACSQSEVDWHINYMRKQSIAGDMGDNQKTGYGDLVDPETLPESLGEDRKNE